MKFFIFCCVLQTISLRFAIVDGSDIPLGSHPYLTTLRSKPIGISFCNGVIVNNYHVVTSAHCVKGRTANLFEIVTRDLSVYSAQSLKIHDGYDAVTMDNDIALIRTVEPMKFNSNVKQATFPMEPPEEDRSVKQLAGWGNTQQYPAWVMPWPKCKNIWGPVLGSNINMRKTCLDQDRYPNNLLHDTTMADDIYVFGLESFGAAGHPPVYTEMSTYHPWIQNNSS